MRSCPNNQLSVGGFEVASVHFFAQGPRLAGLLAASETGGSRSAAHT
jgi:hypothetical protein